MTWLARPPSAQPLELGEIARALGARLSGPPELEIRGLRAPEEAGAGCIAVLHTPTAHGVAACRADALVLPLSARGPFDDPPQRRATLHVDDTRAALLRLIELLHPAAEKRTGVEPGARVHPSAVVAASAYVASGALVEAGVVLEDGVEIHADCIVGRGCRLGRDSVLHPRVVLYPGVQLGQRVTVHAGAVLGSPGFGIVRDERGGQREIPQIGSLVIEDDVRIGANCTIDRATLEATVIGAGTKIDNQVQIGHNTVIGRDCCLVAQVGISGSVRVGDRVILLGQVGVKDHVTLADGAIVGATSAVHSDLGPGEWLGSPAIPAPTARRALIALRRLPELMREVRALRERIAELERGAEPAAATARSRQRRGD